MAEFENEKTLSWCHKSNWNVSQMLALKSSGVLILTFSPQF